MLQSAAAPARLGVQQLRLGSVEELLLLLALLQLLLLLQDSVLE
jgi:hypothetical protein